MTTITATMRIDTDMPDELKKILDHHVDWLIDFDGNADVIKNVEVIGIHDESNANEQFAALNDFIDRLNKLPNASDLLGAMKQKINALLPETTD